MSVEEQKNYILNLPENIKNSLIWYTGDGSEFLKQPLRSGDTIHYPDEFNHIVQAFRGVPPLKNPIVVYKGQPSEKIYQKDHAFVSVSFSFEQAYEFVGDKCCILHITVPAGTKALPLQDISEYPEEQELLLNRNGKFVLTGSDIRKIKGREMKFLYLIYEPENSQHVNIDDINPKIKDKNLTIERMITYLTMLEHEYGSINVDDEFDKVNKGENLGLSAIDKDTVKLRLRM